MGDGTGIVVIKGIGGEIKLRTLHLHIEIEDRHFTLRIILSPVRGQRGLAIHHLTTFEEIGIVIQTVKVEGVGIERGLTVFEHHIISGPRHLLVTIIIGIIRGQRESVALIHPHMSEGLKRIAGLIEIGTVTIKTGTDMSKMDLPVENRGIRVLILVEMEDISMYKINTLILNSTTCRTLSGRTFLLGLSTRHSQKKNNYQKIHNFLHLFHLYSTSTLRPSYALAMPLLRPCYVEAT